MKADKIQQEILLVTTSTFSKRQWCKQQENVASDRHQDPVDQLEEACWNGLLSEMLPEVLEKPALEGRLYLWHIRQGATVLQIELSEQPSRINESFSIYPNFFLSTLVYN